MKLARAQQRALGLLPPTEATFTGQVIGHLHLAGWLVAHFRSVRVQRADGSTHWQTPVQGDGAGFPDLAAVRKRPVPGRINALVAELKVPPNDVTTEQLAWLVAWEAAGVPAFTWTPNDWREIEETTL